MGQKREQEGPRPVMGGSQAEKNTAVGFQKAQLSAQLTRGTIWGAHHICGKKHDSKRYTHPNVLSRTIYSSRDMEAT